jgi:hypothetical protein
MTTTGTEKPVDRLEFESPINLEGSWGQRNLAETTKSTMDLYLHTESLTGYIEWDIPDLDMVEGIGLVFKIDAKGKRTLVDYDGVFTIPDQAMDLLERNGIDCAEMRQTMNS